MATTPKGGPRTVDDPDAKAYALAMRGQRAINEKAHALLDGARDLDWSDVEDRLKQHPGAAESLIPVWGSARGLIADGYEGDMAGVALNGAMLVSYLIPATAVGKGLAKGAVFIAKANTKRAAPYGWKGNVRKWMGEQGHLAPNQHGHHWLIPQNRWGKAVPDAVKNQPWNIKGMPSPEVHWRIEHRVGDKPRFNAAQQYWYGTPAYAKAGKVAVATRGVEVARERKPRP